MPASARKSQKPKDVAKKVQAKLRQSPAQFAAWRKENLRRRKYHSFKLERGIKPEPKDIPNSWQLTKASLKFFCAHFRLFFAVIVIHTLLYVLLVYGSPGLDLASLRSSVESALGDGASPASTNLALLGVVTGAQTQREGAGVLNVMLLLSISLADVWIIRAILNKKQFRIRDAFYSGMTPAVPVLITLGVVVLQLVPFTIASYVYSAGRANGIFVSGLEDLVFFLVTLFLGLFSFYLITPTVMSLYAVTIPGMYPLHTLKLTKKIVKFRRFLVFRRILALPLILTAVFFMVLLLLIRFLPAGSLWFAQLYPIFILPLIHIYLFKLYKSLL